MELQVEEVQQQFLRMKFKGTWVIVQFLMPPQTFILPYKEILPIQHLHKYRLQQVLLVVQHIGQG